MKRKRHLCFVVLLLFGIATACEDRSILHPGIPEAEDNTVLLDFSYRKSTNYYGFVKFQLQAHNITAYQWSFGFLDKDGKLVTSSTSGPGIFFPANGSYEITLKGTDTDLKDIAVTKIVTITSFP